MKSVSCTEFRQNASSLLDEVENGAVITIVRYGRPIAEIAPPRSTGAQPAWKRPGLRLAVDGASLARAVLEERRCTWPALANGAPGFSSLPIVTSARQPGQPA